MANFHRRHAYWLRNLAMVPSYKVKSIVGHQANRLQDWPVERGWDWDGARYNLLSAIASGSTFVLCFLPCWDASEWDGVRQRDVAFFRRWLDFAREHAEVLGRLEDLFDEPRPGAVDGTMALGDDGRGFVFLVNPNYTMGRVTVPVPDGSLLRELHPEPGRLWGAAVAVEPHEVAVLEVVRRAPRRAPPSSARPAKSTATGRSCAPGPAATSGSISAAAPVSYRLLAEARWPAALEDVKCAVRWVRANAARLGVDPERVAVAGGSAGGHLAAMAALTPGRWEGDGGHPDHSSAIQAAVLWYPARTSVP